MREVGTPDPRGETPEGRDPAASEDDFLFHLRFRGPVAAVFGAPPGRQFHGLTLEDTPSAIRVSEGDDVRVDPAALVGWTGRLLPRGRLAGTHPYSLHAPPLSFRGDGVVLVA